MIERVAIENFITVERAEVELSAGLTALTGETGSGKTVLIGAIEAVLGGDVDASMVGPAGPQAWVEAEFQVAEEFWDRPEAAGLRELRPSATEPLILGRRIVAQGRSRCFAWGRSVARSDVSAVAPLLMAVSGQHASQQLTRSGTQRTLLDRAGGAAHAQLVEAVQTAWGELQTARGDLKLMRERAAQAAARSSYVTDALDRIGAVNPAVDEENELLQLRDRARHEATLRTELYGAAGLLDGSDEGGGVVDTLGKVVAILGEVAALDQHSSELANEAAVLQEQAVGLASAVRGSLASLDEPVMAFADIEARLGQYDELHRRFGGTTGAVLALQSELAAEAELITNADGMLAEADLKVQAAQELFDTAAAKLSAARLGIADRVERDVMSQLAELGMGGSVFAISTKPGTPGRSGVDEVAFLIAPAEGVEPGPIAKVASGGELSRIALALHVALGVTDAPTVVFDEIDAGIGGVTAHAVGRLLATLGQTGTQVLCVTHLAQVAARADRFIHVERSVDRTDVTMLDAESAIIDELCRMVGAHVDDEVAREHAHNLRHGRLQRGAPEWSVTAEGQGTIALHEH